MTVIDTQTHRTARRGWLCLALCASAALLGCRSSHDVLPAAAAAGQTQPPPAGTVAHYPRGRWRLATFDELDRVVLWVSRIVVLHDHSQLDGGIPSPTQLTWDVSRPPPKRSRTEALKIAQTAAAEAARDPDHFDQLALRYSDDPLTRERGASLGGVRASQFSASFLDALQAVGRGNTTGVIETSLGFYVLSWRLPPRPEQLAGRHVLIPYLPSTGNTPWAPTRRTREEALVIAQQALAAPRPFTALVQHYSEAADRERDGDMGVWSSLAPLHNGVEIEVLSKLAMGQISTVVDTGTSLQIITRVPVTPRATYAVSALLVHYDPTEKTNGPGSRAASAAAANVLVAQLRSDPSAFDKLHEEKGYTGGLQWTEGAENVELEPVVRSLAIGEIAKTAVDLGTYYLIVKRVEPVAQPPLSYELPAPQAANIDAILRNSDSEGLVAQVHALREAAPKAFRLPTEQQTKLDQGLQSLEARFRAAATPEARVEARRIGFRDLEVSLGQQTYREFDRFFQAWAVWVAINEPHL